MAAPTTYYAPPGRARAEDLLRQREALFGISLMQQMLEGMPHPSMVLNEHRQLLAANKVCVERLNRQVIEGLIGSRPGEFLGCVNVKGGPGGCGTSRYCHLCGAVNAILECQRRREKVTRECRMVVMINGVEECLDLQVSASPLQLPVEQSLMLVTVADISEEKRRQALERTFFHDVLNTSNALQGVLAYLKRKDIAAEGAPWVGKATGLTERLIEEIQAHRDLVSAEHHELRVTAENLSSLVFVREVVESFGPASSGPAARSIAIAPESEDASFSSDATLLRRVLVNLAKNALEAGSEGTVTMGCCCEGDKTVFWVHNPEVMLPDVQLQVFQRSFSTKGPGRGLGTYSVKLLTERYLNGRVTFSSTAEAGTIFRLTL